MELECLYRGVIIDRWLLGRKPFKAEAGHLESRLEGEYRIYRQLVLLGFVILLGCASQPMKNSPSTSSGLADVNGAQIYYETAGVGRDVLLIHGFALDHRMWDDQFTELSKNYRVTRFDVRGSGKSSGALKEFDPVGDIEELMNVLAIDKAHIIGLSMGGQLAADFVLHSPDRSLSLTLIDAYYPIESDEHREFVARIVSHVDKAKEEGLEAGLRADIEDPLFAPARANEGVDARLQEMIMRGHLDQGEGALFINHAQMKPPEVPATERLSHYKLPTLVLIGELDLAVFHQISDVFSDGINGGRKSVIPGAGHMSNMERPKLVTDEIVRFLSSVDDG